MWKDPIVEEVRKVRKELAKECGYDMHKIYLAALKFEKAWKGKIVRQPLKISKN